MKKLNLIIFLFLSSLTLLGQDSLIKRNNVFIKKICLPSRIDESKMPFVIVNGKIVSYDIIEKLNPKKIKSVNVIKRDSSLIFINNSREGVIIITTKKLSKKKLNKLYELYAYEL